MNDRNLLRPLKALATVALAKNAPPPRYHGEACTCEAGAGVIPRDHDADCQWRAAWESEQDDRSKERRHGY